ncbi:GtrA family protein [soil metagenome]
MFARLIAYVRSLLPFLIKFGFVGLACYVIDLLVFNGLRSGLLGTDHFFAGPIGAKIVSATVSTIAAWIGNRLWTFRTQRRTDVGVELLEFIVVAIIGAGIAIACLAVSHYLLGFTSLLADNISGNVIGVVLGTIFRFLSYRYWVFAPTRTRSRSNA